MLQDALRGIDQVKTTVGRNVSDLWNNPADYLRMTAANIPQTVKEYVEDPMNFVGGKAAGIVKPSIARAATQAGIKAYGEDLNPKVKALVEALNNRGVPTNMSGDLYGNKLVYVDVPRAEILNPKRLPANWKVTDIPAKLTEHDVLGTPIDPAVRSMLQARAAAIGDKRLAKAGESISDDEITQLLSVFGEYKP